MEGAALIVEQWYSQERWLLCHGARGWDSGELEASAQVLQSPLLQRAAHDTSTRLRSHRVSAARLSCSCNLA